MDGARTISARQAWGYLSGFDGLERDDMQAVLAVALPNPFRRPLADTAITVVNEGGLMPSVHTVACSLFDLHS
ncbi:hypothetical protein ARMA_1391 [Ardenticatena maritima]|uniref:Uncharacterized protein n=1 Tax=Ardenticatena maritima TaxID=872965 RepID=A0A0M8K919_9CHLR|nr:hypothetical protein ARMA_1391 [Ardenticatena maritima]